MIRDTIMDVRQVNQGTMKLVILISISVCQSATSIFYPSSFPSFLFFPSLDFFIIRKCFLQYFKCLISIASEEKIVEQLSENHVSTKIKICSNSLASINYIIWRGSLFYLFTRLIDKEWS
jgi:hypothetical protein